MATITSKRRKLDHGDHTMVPGLGLNNRKNSTLQLQDDPRERVEKKCILKSRSAPRRPLHDQSMSGSSVDGSGSEGKEGQLELAGLPLDNGSAEAVNDEEAPTQSLPKRTQAQDNGSAIYAGGLYKSNMFKLQVDEMLSEVRPNYEQRLSGVDDALRKLKGLIERIDDHGGVSISEAAKSLQKSYKITAPFPDPKPDKNAAYKLAYARPFSINVVGSYALKTMVKADHAMCVDMVVVMPASIFQEKDYLNYRYFYKRAYYLAYITGGIQDTLQDEYSLNFEYLNGSSLQPMLVVKPRSKSKETHGSSYEIHIVPAAPQDFFAESKLRPNRNSIRPKNTSENQILPPTPFYNAALRSDCNFEPYLKLLHTASKISEGYKDACILGRIWLRQRGFGSGMSRGGFGHFEWAALTALLLKGGGPKGHCVLLPEYSSYQMFKAVIQFISANDLSSKPLVYEASDFVASKADSPMFYDGLRGQNLLYKMSPWSYSLLRQEARSSLAMLNDSTFDQFEPTFIIRASQPLQRFDCVFRASVPTKVLGTTSDHHSQTFSFGSRLFQVLQEGLGDRLALIDIKTSDPSPWPIKSTGPALVDETLLVCVVFDTANIDRLVDHGPSAEEKKNAATFQKFWGNKAELRRFKDGSILESLVWSPGSTYAIFQEIVTYLMKRHFDSEVSNSLTFFGEVFERLLPGHGTSMKSFEALKLAFNTLEKSIRGLESLPLQLRQLSAVSPQLRYSSIDLPSFSQNRPLKNPADVLIQFEGSGRWPDDIVAIQRTKIAFLLKIGSLLEESDDSIITRLGLENEDQILRNCAFLDVIYKSGAAFRLRIHNDREQTLMERLIKEKYTDNRTREEAVLALLAFKKAFTQLPLHTQSIVTHCTRFPLLSPTIRLVKMWFDRHLLSGHFSEEFIELLVTRTFLQPYPWRAPSSAMTGVLRTLLFVSRWDWRLAPLIVDFTGTITSADVSSTNTRLEAWRKIDPALNRTVLFAASNHDMSGTAFTDEGPSKMVAARMTALARSACKLVKEKGLELDHRSLFATSTAEYDFVIHLSSRFIGDKRRKEGAKQNFKNLEVQSEADLEAVGYNPVQLYLNDLKKVYTNSIVFFYSEVTSSVIAGLWNPQMVAARPFKVNLAYATKPVVGKGVGEIVIDKPVILSEIARIGGDMVSRIEVNR